MKRILMAIMAVAVAVTFSAPAFAEGTDKDKEGKKDTNKPKFVQMLNADDKDKDKPAKPTEPAKPDTKK